MMIEQFRQLGYKAEAVELTAETLTATNYATAWETPLIEEDSEYNERRPDRATLAPLQGQAGSYIGKFTGKFEPRPSGTDNTAPDWYALVSAAGASVTTDVATFGAESISTSVIGNTVTMKSRDGNYENTLAGTKVSKLRFFAEKGSVWSCETEATGRFSRATQTAFVAAAHPSAGLGQPFLGMTCTVGTFTGAVSSAEISIENVVANSVDCTHASGYGRNVITEQKLMFRATAIVDGLADWRDKYRNDSAGDLLAVSLQMSAGSAGNVLTWTGNLSLTAQPKTTYVDGIGYVQLEGEFVTTTAAAALTLTQS